MQKRLRGRPKEGGLFLKSDLIGFQTGSACGGIEASKGRNMKAALADFIKE
jgi:hypothetical protein